MTPAKASTVTRIRLVTLLGMIAMVSVMTASAALADHPAPFLPSEPVQGSTAFNSGGEGAEWNLVGTLFTGNPQTDLDFFTQDGQTYASVGTLATSANGGGQTIVRLVDADGEVVPELVSSHPSAACPALASGVTGLQHDVEATPKGEAILNTDWEGTADTSDTQLLLDATDAPGRCHDNANGVDLFGVPGAPQGGIEFIDVTDIENPVEIGLTTHIGQAHTVNIDPKRPHIAYVASSDGVDFNGEDRANDTAGLALDGFEIVDLSSCMDFADGTSTQARRGLADDGSFLDGEGCRPEVFRYRYPRPLPGHTDKSSIFACHELELYPDDTVSCASGQFSGLFDVSGAFDDNGTPDDFTDDTVNGDPLPCRLRNSTSQATPTAAPVVDCVVGEGDQDLSVSGWLDIGAPSVEGITFEGAAFHQGRSATQEVPTYGADEGIDFSHEAELTRSGDFLIASDERGGGVVPPDASCSPPSNVPQTNGGLSAYAVDRFDSAVPPVPDSPDGEAFDPYARTPEGDKAIFRVTPRVPAATFCTAHVFQQIPGQDRIFMGWYTQGTVVVDFVENADGTFEFSEAGYFIPENANTWVSHVFKVDDNGDGTFTYFGATGDFNLGGAGRNAVDVYSVTLPAPASASVGEGTDPDAEDPDGAPDDGDDSDSAPDDDDDTDGAPEGGDGSPGNGGSLAATGGGVAGLAALLLGAATVTTRRRRRSG